MCLPGFFYLLLELCEGGTLKDFLASREKGSALPEPYMWYVLHQIAGALAVLRAHDIVHLDIKPDNIFTTRSGRLKIGDFGMATDVVADSSRQIEEPEGDAVYMAPELLSSSNRLPSADVFCLGTWIFFVRSQRTLVLSSYLNMSCIRDIAAGNDATSSASC